MAKPKLRFPEFTDEWEETVLEKKAYIYDGTHQTPQYVSKGVKFVSVENIHDIYNTDKFISEEAYERYKIKPQVDDILMTRITAGVIGDTAIISKDEPLAYYVSLALIRKRGKIDTNFLAYNINSNHFRHELHKRIIHVAFPKKINLGDIGKCEIAFPKENEQQKIADFLSSVDDVIQIQEEKISVLEEQRKGIMQKLFNREVRFKEENGSEYPEWEERTFGDVFESLEYGMNTAAMKYDGVNKYIRITDIDDVSHRYLDDDIVSPSGDLNNKYLVNENDILFARTGASTGKCYLYRQEDGKLYFAGFLIRGHVKSDYNSFFIFTQTLTEQYEKWVKIMSIRSGQPGINATEYALFKFNCPCSEEQQKIADCLSAYDEAIQIKKDKLEIWKEIKKGLLQQMFV